MGIPIALHPAKQGGAKVEQGGAVRIPENHCSTTLLFRGGGGGGGALPDLGGGWSGRWSKAMTDTIESNGQTFTKVRVEGHVRVDGQETLLAVWSGRCADCGAPFEQRQSAHLPIRWFSRRCAEHKRPGVKVGG